MERPFAVTELDHVVLRCRDPERALAFYRDVIGLPEERRLDALGLVQLRAGRSLVDLIADPTTDSRTVPNVDHVCLGVEARDVDALVQWLVAHDVELIGEPMTRYGARGYGPSIYFRDPEGNVVELKLAEAAGA